MTAGAESSAPATPPLLRIAGLTKAFGATQALRDATFDLRRGEVHALVGENGSGKSTLVKIVSGVHRPDAGSVEFSGVAVTMRSPHAAQLHGIVTVFQEVLVAESCSVLDNVWLGSDTWRTRTPRREKQRRAAEVLERLLGHRVDLSRPVEDLGLGDRQVCCIARALVRDPQVLILDEATAALDIATRDRLFAIVRELAERGVGVVVITHRLDELSAIGDRLTVLRSGETVGTVSQGEWTPDDLIRLMTGADALAQEASEYARPLQQRRRGPVLSVRALRLIPGAAPIDVTIEGGVLLGVAGLEGHGGNEFLEALRGGGDAEGDVMRHVEGQDVPVRSPQDAADLGVVLVPRERRLDSLVGWMSIRENFALATMEEDRRAGWLSPRSSQRRFQPYARALGIKYGDEADAITTLSGGNQQKVVIARWLAYHPSVLILNDPTRGVSISTKRELYRLLAALADQGVAIVMLSSELDEHLELMDRVLVFREHSLATVIDRRGLSRDRLVSAFFGEGAEEAEEDGRGTDAAH